MKVMHVITGLETGGAETMLYKLTSGMRPDEFDNVVISLTNIGPTGEKMKSAGIRVEALGMKRGVPDPRFIFRLATIIRSEKPDLVQTWLYHSDLLGGLAAVITGIPVMWNIRQDTPNPDGTKKLTLLSAKICAKLSRHIPAKIVCCSESAQWAHHEFGHDLKKFYIIPNGFDLDTFQPDSQAYESVRKELGLDRKQIIIGHAARFHPMKDHGTMLAACAIVHRKYPEVHFVLCGPGVNKENKELADEIKEYAMEDVCHLLGTREDMPRLTAAFDIACLSSISGEGFPNVIGEAMACAIPCVVTDVGESKTILGDRGFVTFPGSPDGLAHGLIEMIKIGQEGRKSLGNSARQRVEQLYSLPNIINLYEDLYRDFA